MGYYGYHRTSTVEQHLDRGIEEIKSYCQKSQIELKKIYTDQSTGKNFNRPKYQILKEVLREGDTLIISEVDRLGRNKQDIKRELLWLQESHIRLMVLEIPTTLMDLNGMENEMAGLLLEMMSNLFMEIYITMAEAEMHKKEKRQREGLEAMRARGDWYKMGRPKVMEKKDFDKEYKRVKSGEVAPFQLMKELGMKKSTYYHYKKIYDAEHQNQGCAE